MSTQSGQAMLRERTGLPAVPAQRQSKSGTSWRYPARADGRDLRIDFLRGLAIIFVVVDHINLNSAFFVVSHERIGAISGAELFVLLSGLVLGMVHRRRAIAEGWRASAARMWSRARLLYVVSILVILLAFLISLVPLVNGDVLTTWTDESSGITYSLYGSTPLLTDYPVPPPAIFDILTLNVGPYQFNVMGLYVILLLLAPLALRLLLAGRWWLLVLISTGMWALNLFDQWRLVPSSFATQFPPLSWQILFVLGLTIGFYFSAIQHWFDGQVGRATALVAWLAFAVFLFVTWNNPAKLADPWALRLDFIPAESFWKLYDVGFRRDILGPLRILNVIAALIALYAFLTRFWTPVYCTLGWIFIPLGGATLYVFILHVVFVLIVGSLPFINSHSLLVGTLTHTGVLFLLWLMVRTKFLFRWVPR